MALRAADELGIGSHFYLKIIIREIHPNFLPTHTRNLDFYRILKHCHLIYPVKDGKDPANLETGCGIAGLQRNRDDDTMSTQVPTAQGSFCYWYGLSSMYSYFPNK
jgi:hypothetical protein